MPGSRALKEVTLCKGHSKGSNGKKASVPVKVPGAKTSAGSNKKGSSYK